MDYSLYFISFTECFISFLRMRNQKVSLARIDIIGHQQINPILINPRTDMLCSVRLYPENPSVRAFQNSFINIFFRRSEYIRSGCCLVK